MTARKVHSLRTIASNVVVVSYGALDLFRTFASISLFGAFISVMYAHSRKKDWLGQSIDAMTSAFVTIILISIVLMVLRVFMPGRKAKPVTSAIFKSRNASKN